MNLSVLWLLLLSVSAQSTVSSNNYDGMKDFLQGFMSAFFRANFTLPTDCMTPTFQSKIDSDLVAFAKMVITGHLENAVTYFAILGDDWDIMAQACNVTSVESFIEQQYKKEGVWTLAFNTLLNLIDIVPRFLEMLGSLVEDKWMTAGGDLGIIFRRIFNPLLALSPPTQFPFVSHIV